MMLRKTETAYSPPPYVSRASMRPQHDAAENKEVPAVGVHKTPASMRPQHDAAENQIARANQGLAPLLQ